MEFTERTATIFLHSIKLLVL